MDEDNKKQQELDEEQDDFFKDLLDGENFDDEDQHEDPDDKAKKDDESDPESDTETDKTKKDGDDGLTEEEQRRKNKDAEEARKRREAEEKAKKAEEAKKDESDKKEADRTNKLGEQLVQFRKKYPDVELAELDKDKSFKKFIDGKLLGKKDFISLYEDYLEMRSEFSGKTPDEVRKVHRKKEQASSGSSLGSSQQPNTVSDVYSEEEIERLSQKIPLMSHQEAERVMEKFDRSIDYYKKQKN